MSKYEKMSKEIIQNVGGENNVESLYHCATRLRFKLKDEGKLDTEKMSSTPGVITVVKGGGQIQVVIGQHVSDVYREIIESTHLSAAKSTDEAADTKKKSGLLNSFFDLISGVFTPLLAILTATGVIKGLLALVNAFHWITPESGAYQLLTIISDCFFYFFPVFLGYTSMKKFGGTPFVGMAIGAALIHPNLLGISSGEPLYTLFSGTVFESPIRLEFFGIPVILMSYASSVIPIILASYVAAKLEKLFGKYISNLIKTFAVPTLVLLIVIPLTFIVIGPVATWLSQLLGLAASGLYNLNSTIFGFLYGALIQVILIFGLHWGFVAIAINNITVLGYDPVTVLGLTAGFGQAGALLMAIKQSKNSKTKEIGIPAFISSLFGITEPAVYGVNLNLKRPFIIGCISTGIGGAIMGFSSVKQYSFGANGVFGFLNVINPEKGIDFSVYATIFACLASFIISIILMQFFGIKKAAAAQSEITNTETSKVTKTIETQNVLEFQVPLTGRILALEEVNDEAFSNKAMGEGIAVDPSDGKVIAPFEGKVVHLMEKSKHALILEHESGVQILIHIGMDTVSLKGKGFVTHVSTGDQIKKGQTLVEFDIPYIKEAGYSTVTPVIVPNGQENVKNVEIFPSGETAIFRIQY